MRKNRARKSVPTENTKTAPPQRKQKPQNWQRKSTPSSSATNTILVDSHAPVDDFHDTIWFKAGKGDLDFAQWLLNRCNGVGDAHTLRSEAATQRMFALFKVQLRLRRELAVSTKKDAGGVEEDEEDVEWEHVEEPLWSVEEIVKQVGDVLRKSLPELLKQQREAVRNNTKLNGVIERVVVVEVVENATELILSRAMKEEEHLLRQWMGILREDRKVDEVESDVSSTLEVEPEVINILALKDKRKQRKMRNMKTKIEIAVYAACKQVGSFLAFLQESAAAGTLTQGVITTPCIGATTTWASELKRLAELSSIQPEEEERRKMVALDIQEILRREVAKWRSCKVVLFGSSVTHYGSRHSDLDMCLLYGGSTRNDVPPSVSKRQLQHLIDDNECEKGRALVSNTERAAHFQALSRQAIKNLEKVTLELNSVDRLSMNGKKRLVQLFHLEYFHKQLRLLCNAIKSQLAELVGIEESHLNDNANGTPAHLQSVIAASRRFTENLYLLRATLQRAAKCEIRHVIAGARVPIIRFLHTLNGRKYECDLCFENILATRNTSLLRAYADFDDRARVLGLAVKHWAKKRGICDASTGFLNSYSFVLLSIYFLQIVRVLPNLQDADLLEIANIPFDIYNDVNIAFCEDRDIAQAYHMRKLEEKGLPSYSLATLLAGFFEFYATQFDFARQVVTVRSPETRILKLALWGSRKAKSWRMSIQDPLEIDRDIGCVLQFKGQMKIIGEFRRAHEMLMLGKSFSEEICAVAKAKGNAANAKQGARMEAATSRKPTIKDKLPASGSQCHQEKQEADKQKCSYIIFLQSADVELTEAAIKTLFKTFQKSLQILNVTEAAPLDRGVDSKCANKQWKVELLTQKLPRAFSQRTHIDWKASDGRMGRVWVHHQASIATPSCQSFLSSKHATSSCPSGDDNKGAGAGEKGTNRDAHRRHVFHLNKSSSATKKDHRKKSQQQNGAVHDTRIKSFIFDTGDQVSGRGNNRSGNKRAQVGTDTVVRRVELIETEKSTSCSTPIDKSTNPPIKMTQKKRRQQQRAYKKKTHVKEGTNNGAAL
ncbi:hypothetical protein CCR75_006789 [Bremia lactucae]|uniref:PAP-associated domain-containing protein n=1 Tax=Bremia lactucae TaxID=4779 RepID=A0A976FJB9_BRELC|nr:hypothetical protein CCR75_006789 [Bremia lactucae]